MAETLTQAGFKEFERQFSAIRKANQEARLDAVGLLTPELLRKHLASKTPITLPYGRKGQTISFSYEDLKGFDDALKRVKVLNRSNVPGLPLMALENASGRDDKRRMRAEIRSAVLYKISGNTLTFRVSASGNNEAKFYQVRVRLESWDDHMTDTGNWMSAARAAAVGNISFDCGCGRHQYWYRYLATISNCALVPKEKDFPKIRNPKLTGFCCKHTLKAFQQLKSGVVHKLLAKEMERQAKEIGYMTPGKAKFLNAAQLAKMRRAKGSDRDLAAARAAYRDFQKAREAIRRKLKEPKVKEKQKKMEDKLKAKTAEAAAQKARAQAAEKALSDAQLREAQLKRDALVGQVGMYVMRAMFQEKKTREQALTEFAGQNNLTYAEVDELAKGANV